MSQARRKRRAVDGVLVLDKPLGYSSNQALQKVRWLLNADKGGHTGSLDPMASGVLPLCFGEATKFSKYLLDAEKGYRTRMRLGEISSTGDTEGEIIERNPVDVSLAQFEAVLPGFRGPISQVPPMHSALKKDGQPLYKLARAGEVVERQPRSVTIERLELVAFEPPLVTLDVLCSKGTYIRSLVEDIGQALGCGAHVAELQRTEAGPFSLGQAVSLDELIAAHEAGGAEALDRYLLPVDSGLEHWPLISLGESAAHYWLHGQTVRCADGPRFGWVRVCDNLGRFIGIGEMTDDGRVAPRRLIRSE